MIRKILRFFKLCPYVDFLKIQDEKFKLMQERDFYAGMCIIEKGKVIKEAGYVLETTSPSTNSASVVIGGPSDLKPGDTIRLNIDSCKLTKPPLGLTIEIEDEETKEGQNE